MNLLERVRNEQLIIARENHTEQRQASKMPTWSLNRWADQPHGTERTAQRGRSGRASARVSGAAGAGSRQEIEEGISQSSPDRDFCYFVSMWLALASAAKIQKIRIRRRMA